MKYFLCVDSRRVCFSYKQEYVHEVPVNMSWKKYGYRLTDSPDMPIAVDWAVKPQTKQKLKFEKNTSNLMRFDTWQNLCYRMLINP